MRPVNLGPDILTSGTNINVENGFKGVQDEKRGFITVAGIELKFYLSLSPVGEVPKSPAT